MALTPRPPDLQNLPFDAPAGDRVRRRMWDVRPLPRSTDPSSIVMFCRPGAPRDAIAIGRAKNSLV